MSFDDESIFIEIINKYKQKAYENAKDKRILRF